MKIQPTTPNSSLHKSKKTSKTSSSSFDNILSSKIEDIDTPTQPTQGAEQQNTPQNQDIEEAVQTLEECIRTLNQDPQQTIEAINKLREDLKNQHNLSTENRQELETLLAVEAKRLEKIDSI